MRHPGRGDAYRGLRRRAGDAAWLGYAGLVWGYAFAWFLVTDPVKLLAYKVLDAVKADAAPAAKAAAPSATQAPAKPGAKAEPRAAPAAAPKAEADTEPKPGAKAETGPDAKAEPKAEA